MLLAYDSKKTVTSTQTGEGVLSVGKPTCFNYIMLNKFLHIKQPEIVFHRPVVASMMSML